MKEFNNIQRNIGIEVVNNGYLIYGMGLGDCTGKTFCKDIHELTNRICALLDLVNVGEEVYVKEKTA